MAFAEQEALKTAWRAVARSGTQDPEAFIAAIPRDARARRRAQTITQSAEACFFHLGQTLDRLAAAAVIVGGFEVDNVANLYWSTLEGIARELDAGPASERVQPAGSSGRAAQEALMGPVIGWTQYGVDDWLRWMRNTRNAMTHRSPGNKTNVTSGNRLARLFYRQPKWSELQSLLFGARPPRKPFFDAFIFKASEDVLDGVCESTAKLVEALTDAMVTCWNARRADPQMIVQHGRQWPTVEPGGPISNFPGYGEDLVVTSNQMRLNTLDGRRWETARLMDDRRQDWYT